MLRVGKIFPPVECCIFGALRDFFPVRCGSRLCRLCATQRNGGLNRAGFSQAVVNDARGASQGAVRQVGVAQGHLWAFMGQQALEAEEIHLAAGGEPGA